MGEQAVLVKFGQYAHILQLQEKGLLYMNNLPYFWKIEDKELRGDLFDSVHEVQRGRKGKISWSNGKKKSTEITNWILRIHPPESKKINIFCMYALRPFVETFPVDEKNFLFGDYALVVTNPQEFIDRIGLYLKGQNIKGNFNLVEYVDDGHIGKVGPFKKLKRFAYQSEWRLVCYDGPEGARKISIGSIRDISFIIPSSEINEKITISS